MALTYSNDSLIAFFFWQRGWEDILKSGNFFRTTYFLDIDIEMLILVDEDSQQTIGSIRTVF